MNWDSHIRYASLKFLGSQEVADLNITLLTSADRKATNTLDQPYQVQPALLIATLHALNAWRCSAKTA